MLYWKHFWPGPSIEVAGAIPPSKGAEALRRLQGDVPLVEAAVQEIQVKSKACFSVGLNDM
jgi:hypothetical protein